MSVTDIDWYMSVHHNNILNLQIILIRRNRLETSYRYASELSCLRFISIYRKETFIDKWDVLETHITTEYLVKF